MAKYNSYKYITLQRACKESEARRKTEQAEVSPSGDAAYGSTMSTWKSTGHIRQLVRKDQNVYRTHGSVP